MRFAHSHYVSSMSNDLIRQLESDRLSDLEEEVAQLKQLVIAKLGPLPYRRILGHPRSGGLLRGPAMPRPESK
jgi:hypothetical protein